LTIQLFSVSNKHMKTVRIQGLVRLANHVRQQIAQPITPERLTQLRKSTSRSIETVNRMLHNHGARLDALPGPSRKAYEFLTGIDFDSVETSEVPSSRNFAPNSISFPGLNSYLKTILDQIARNADDSRLWFVCNSIRKTSSNIEKQISDDGIMPEELTNQSRHIRGWLAYFAQEDHFSEYLAAVRRAKPIFFDALPEAEKQLRSLLIHFQPMQGIYRFRWYKNAILIQLPTPMICFEKETFRLLADQIFQRHRNRQQVQKAMLSETYQEILSELDLLSGVVEQTTGVCYDLAASFDRVNATYFNGGLSRPRLVWSHTFTSRKFGHYDRTHDTIMVSMSLDNKNVPEYVTDFIMYHELLHKTVGVAWNNHRQAVHTPRFLEEEQRFHRYAEAKDALDKLSSGRHKDYLST